MNIKNTRFLCAVMAAFLIFAAGCSANMPPNKVHSPEDLSGSTVGVLKGSVSESYAEALDSVVVRAFTDSDALASELKNGGVDAAIVSGEVTGKLTKKPTAFRILETPLVSADYRIAVSQENKTLLQNVNNRLDAMTRDGSLSALASAWLSGAGEVSDSQPVEFPRLTVAVDPTLYPFCYHDENGNLTGFEVELIRSICRGLDVEPEFQEVSSDMLLYMVESGKVSLAVGRLSAGGSAVYSNSYLTMVQDILVRKD